MRWNQKPAAFTTCCEYNHGINCAGDDCERCGWNPEVHRERVEKLRERKPGKKRKVTMNNDD